jgi:hypothetical protein
VELMDLVAAGLRAQAAVVISGFLSVAQELQHETQPAVMQQLTPDQAAVERQLTRQQVTQVAMVAQDLLD